MTQKTWIRRVAVLVAVAMTAGLGYLGYEYFLGRAAAVRAAELLQGMEKGRVTWIQLAPFHIESKGRKVQDYPVVHEKDLVDPGTLDAFRSIVTSPWTYSDTTYMCFDPGMAFRFKTQDRELEFVICLACARIRIWENNVEQNGRWFLSGRGIANLLRIYEAHAIPSKS